MTATIVAVSLTLAMNSFGLGYAPLDATQIYPYQARHISHHVDHIMPPGPGYGWGFPNDNPDHYGWVDYGVDLPLGADRTPEYYFPRFLAVPPEQMFLQTYLQLPSKPAASAIFRIAAPAATIRWADRRSSRPRCRSLPMPTLNDDKPVTPVPRLNGRVEASRCRRAARG